MYTEYLLGIFLFFYKNEITLGYFWTVISWIIYGLIIEIQKTFTASRKPSLSLVKLDQKSFELKLLFDQVWFDEYYFKLQFEVPLLCVSSLICLWGEGHRSSSDDLNILLTSTLLKHPETNTCHVTYTYCVHCVCICGDFRCCFHLHALYLYDLM